LELSLVIPVFNGAQTIEPVVDAALSVFRAELELARAAEETAAEARGGAGLEIVLINDGSSDDSEAACRRLAAKHPGVVRFLQLSRNFGEHAAVMAGLHEAGGRYCIVLDDDGQHPPREAVRLWRAIRERQCDVVYGRYREKHHHWFRNFGSWLNGAAATWLLRKPRHLYLSSFKVMNSFVVREVTRYEGPFPYIDGLVFQVTDRIEQIDVEHSPRQAGRSGYTFRKLVRLWMNMFLGFSVAPLRGAVMLGFGTSAFSALLLLSVILDKLFVNPDVPVGIPTVLIAIALFAGLQMFLLGMLGEYIGRIVLTQNGQPQSIVRYRIAPRNASEPAPAPAPSTRPSASSDATEDAHA
jgi:undecaprenyl-phosphate 4-deoxy-4-formamido-L-arabinose transferase